VIGLIEVGLLAVSNCALYHHDQHYGGDRDLLDYYNLVEMGQTGWVVEARFVWWISREQWLRESTIPKNPTVNT
jgi:hypothetical protein